MLPIHSLSTWFNTFLSIYPKKRLLEPIIYSKECYSHYKSYSRFFFSIYSSSADGSPIRLSIGVLPNLASVFRKLLGRCLYPLKPTSKFGQGGFREAPSFPDQTLCLAMICNMLCRYHRTTLILAFLDINSAYDTVNRRKIWEVMQATAEPPLLALLQNLFDGVHIEILFQNATSRRFQPITGMLQGSILLPPPNTIYINQLPHILSAQPFQEDLSLIQLAPLMNCLLYVDDGVLIADQYKMVELLQKCEEHNTALNYQLYGELNLAYLGISFKSGGHINTTGLITVNTTMVLAIFAQIAAIGVNPRDFGHLLSARFYVQTVRAHSDYCLAIGSVLPKQVHPFPLWWLPRILCEGDAPHGQTADYAKEGHVLQFRFLLRSLRLPEDALLTKFLFFFRQPNSRSQWYKLSKNTLWQRCSDIVGSLVKKRLRQLRFKYLQANMNKRRSEASFRLPSACRPTICLNPILWLLMSRIERSLFVRWRLG
ncbi:hypothetical protein G6F70_008659 [Rhizopus microsporus]|nr:hypothetical protein G6F71_005648 [Rhizopus microsporus]KAG1194888.1 hypothetical protein G6F70_008659 [Rhizopus microsporus]KAG1206709.1 hypothetical protein G6F69_008630 [Rhizopus microsporus]